MGNAQICTECGRSCPESELSEELCPECRAGAGVHEKAGNQTVTTRRSTHPRADIPKQIGSYKILSRLGEGGMGVVYLAEQYEPVRRRVAIKALKRGLWESETLARFENEEQALALMDHSCVAKVFDAGITAEGRPYFVMEYVAGITITTYCDKHHLDVRDRLELFTKVCDAVQHAHQKGIIHRDLKPSNVLVSLQDGRPVPKVIDFGVAKAVSRKLIDRTLVTEQGQFIGTPEYMSPEQADLTDVDIDTRSDIYSLGVLLFELMTGSLPFDPADLRRTSLAAMQKVLQENEPPKPSMRLAGLGERSTIAAKNRNTDLRSLRVQLAGDLDWVILKALEKDRTRRYESASGFAADIRRHLADQPVLAHAPSAAYRLRKFVKRNRVAVAAGAMVLLALVAGLALATAGFVQASRERDRTRIEADKAQVVNRFLKQMLSSVQPIRARGREVMVKEVLDEAAGKIEGAFPGQQEVESSIRYTVGTTYLSLGQYSKAREQLEVARELARSSLAELDPARLLINAGLGNVARSQGRFSQGEKLMRRALEGQRKVLGDKDPDTLGTMNNLALVLMEQGKFAEAEKEFIQVVRLRSEGNTEDKPETFLAIANLARVLLSQGKTTEAGTWADKAETSSRAVLGTDHPTTIYAISIRAWHAHESGEMEKAGELRRETYDLSRGTFGESHPSTLTALQYLAGHLGAMNRGGEAVTLLREALDAQKRKLGSTHPSTLDTMMALANNLPESSDEAGRIYLEVYEIRVRELGPENLSTLDALNDLGIWHWERGEIRKADSTLRQVVDARTRVLGQDHTHTLDAKNNLGLVLLEQDRDQEAVSLYQEVLEGQLVFHPDDHPAVVMVQSNLGLALMGVGSHDKAAELLASAYKSQSRSYGEDNWRTLKTAYLLSWAMIEDGRLEEAERLLDDSLQRSLATLGADNQITLRLQTIRGQCYAKNGNYEEGERLILTAWRAETEKYGKDSGAAAWCGKFLADLYLAWGRPADAACWLDGSPSESCD